MRMTFRGISKDTGAVASRSTVTRITRDLYCVSGRTSAGRFLRTCTGDDARVKAMRLAIAAAFRDELPTAPVVRSYRRTLSQLRPVVVLRDAA